MTELIRIIGIDPGSQATGWGVIEKSGFRIDFVGAGVIRPPKTKAQSVRLSHIFEALTRVVEDFEPHQAAVEETFVNASPRDALVLGQARGVALLVPAVGGLRVAEYAANSVKKSVVGRGHADKVQVQSMVRVLLPTSGKQPADAADALAVAICHAHHAGLQRITDKSMRISA